MRAKSPSDAWMLLKSMVESDDSAPGRESTRKEFDELSGNVFPKHLSVRISISFFQSNHKDKIYTAIRNNFSEFVGALNQEKLRQLEAQEPSTASTATPAAGTHATWSASTATSSYSSTVPNRPEAPERRAPEAQGASAGPPPQPAIKPAFKRASSENDLDQKPAALDIDTDQDDDTTSDGDTFSDSDMFENRKPSK